MNAYIYQASLYCETCGPLLREAVEAHRGKPLFVDDETTYDSGDYPKGPYPNGGGEADYPQSCVGCKRPLENPLTDEGVDYVRRALKDALAQDYAVRVWLPIYRTALGL